MDQRTGQPEGRLATSNTGLLAGCAGLLLVLVAAFAFWSNLQATGGVEAMRRAAEIQSSALTFLSRVQDAESGQRGFLLTGDPAFLAPYEAAMGLLESDLQRLEAAARADAEQARRVAHVRKLLARKQDELTLTVTLIQENRRDDAVAEVSAAAGKAAMDDIRLVITRILETGDEAILKREVELQRWDRLSLGAIAASAATALVLTMLALLLARRELVASRSLGAHLAQVNDQLEAEVVRRTRDADAARAEAVAQKERAEAERSRVELLLQDVNHRIGNNLAMVSGMLGVQIAATANEDVRALLRAAQGRVATIANAQRRLRLGSDLSTVRADDMIESVMTDLSATVGDERRIKIETQLEPILVESRDAVHLAVLANEIATNAVKHAFGNEVDEGRILVSMHLDEERHVRLVVEDDGVGLPADGAIEQGAGLGSKLVVRMAGQFGGVPRAERGAMGGTRVVISLPELEVRRA